MTDARAGQLMWRKARASSAGNCVEVAPTRDGVAVRDSKNPAGPMLLLAPGVFDGWVAAAKRGDLDRLLEG